MVPKAILPLCRFGAGLVVLLAAGCGTPDPLAQAVTWERWGAGRFGKSEEGQAIARMLEEEVFHRPLVVLRPLRSRRLKNLLPEYTAYRAEVCDTSIFTTFRRLIYYALLVREDAPPVFLETDAEVCRILTSRKQAIHSRRQAWHLAMAFAELRGYELSERVPSLKGNGTGTGEKAVSGKTVQRPLESESDGDGWRFSCVFLCDPEVRHYRRYVIRVGPAGSVEAQRGDLIYAETLHLKP